MRRTYGQIEIDLPGYVAIFDDSPATPIFHDREGYAGPSGEKYERRTRCGKVIYLDGIFAIEIAARHAVRFARPCATCWPALRNQPALFKRTARRRDRATQLEAVDGD